MDTDKIRAYIIFFVRFLTIRRLHLYVAEDLSYLDLLLAEQRNATEKTQDDSPKGSDMLLIHAPQSEIIKGKSLFQIFGHLSLRLDSLVFAFYNVNNGTSLFYVFRLKNILRQKKH